MTDAPMLYFGPGSFQHEAHHVAMRKLIDGAESYNPIPGNVPCFEGISEDGCAIFSHGELRSGITGDRMAMTLDQVKNVIKNADLVGMFLGNDYKKIMLREFTNARYALAMGKAVPKFPAVKDQIAKDYPLDLA